MVRLWLREDRWFSSMAFSTGFPVLACLDSALWYLLSTRISSMVSSPDSPCTHSRTNILGRLVEKDRHDDAKKVLTKLRSDGSLEQDELVDLELKEIVDVVYADRLANQTSWKTIFLKDSWRKRLILGCGVQAFGPLSGISKLRVRPTLLSSSNTEKMSSTTMVLEFTRSSIFRPVLLS